jgi:chemosensory pili system protein ChpA (sensor histidine kinase/response regulator)
VARAPDDVEKLRPIRRVFHTLKGSGRLVGARTLGEFSWRIESMLNRVLDGSRPASAAVVAMVDQAFYALPQLHAALRGESGIAADLEGMQGRCRSHRRGRGRVLHRPPAAAAEAVAAAGKPMSRPAGVDKPSSKRATGRRPGIDRSRSCSRSSIPRSADTWPPSSAGSPTRGWRLPSPTTSCCAPSTR